MATSISAKGKGKEIALQNDQAAELEKQSGASSSSSSSDSDSDSSNSDASDSDSESEEEITQEYLNSLLEKARQAARARKEHKEGEFVGFEEQDHIQLDEDEESA